VKHHSQKRHSLDELNNFKLPQSSNDINLEAASTPPPPAVSHLALQILEEIGCICTSVPHTRACNQNLYNEANRYANELYNDYKSLLERIQRCQASAPKLAKGALTVSFAKEKQQKHKAWEIAKEAASHALFAVKNKGFPTSVASSHIQDLSFDFPLPSNQDGSMVVDLHCQQVKQAISLLNQVLAKHKPSTIPLTIVTGRGKSLTPGPLKRAVRQYLQELVESGKAKRVEVKEGCFVVYFHRV
jgi:Smr domain